MGLNVGVKSGTSFYVNHIGVKVLSAANKPNEVSLEVLGKTFVIKNGATREVFNGVSVSMQGKSTPQTVRLDITAPNDVVILRESVYNSVVAATGGYVVTQHVYRWLADNMGFTSKDDVHEEIRIARGTANGQISTFMCIFHTVDNLIYNVERNED